MSGPMSEPLPAPSAADLAPSTRLSGRWLLAARLGWLLLFALTVITFVIQIPAYLASANRPNPESAALSPGALADLERIGVTASVFNGVALAILCVAVMVTVALSLALAWRRSDDWMALLVSLFLISYIIANIGIPSNTANLPPDSPLALLGTLAQTVPNFVITFAVLLLFPDGRFVPRWSWMLLTADTLWAVVLTALPSLFGGALFLGYPVVVGSAIACIIYRYRHASTPVQRQQTKWIVVGLVTTLLANQMFWIPVGFTPLGQTLYAPAFFLLYQLVLLLTPVTFFIAVQRYRLYEIDTIINRALVYGALSAVLIGLYAACVIGAQSLIVAFTRDSGPQPSIVIVATTLLVAALFRPLRDHLQALVDRRFYRRKYDAAKTIDAFTARLRQEVDLPTLQEQLLATVEQTMQPSHASLWLRRLEARGNGPERSW